MTEINLKAPAQALVAATRARSDLHPPPAELLSYHAGELSDDEQERILHHLASCSECARAVLDMANFPNVEPSDPKRRLQAAEVSRRWERFRGRLREEASPPEPTVAPTRRPRAWFASLFFSLRFAQSAAAALLVVTVGLSLTLFSQRRPVPESSRPRLNVHVAELIPEAEDGQRTEDGLAVRVPATADSVLLSLALLDPRSFPAYEVEIRERTEPESEVMWRSTGLARSREGVFTLEIPRGFLPAGRYRIAIRGLDAEVRELLATYDLILEYESRRP